MDNKDVPNKKRSLKFTKPEPDDPGVSPELVAQRRALRDLVQHPGWQYVEKIANEEIRKYKCLPPMKEADIHQYVLFKSLQDITTDMFYRIGAEAKRGEHYNTGGA